MGDRAKTVEEELNKSRDLLKDLIYGALTHISNRYQLCQLASKATRKLHKPNTRLQDTTNEVLVRFHEASPMGAHGDAKVALEQVSQQRRAA